MTRMPAKTHVARNLQLKPADPFELIRWLARSQADPRKGVAELVQNSLDAGATRVIITRRRHRGVVELSVKDDGEGVLPDLPREDALAYLATHVGRSRKLGLDPAERAQRVIAGKYGVGLLGFWCIGHVLELRSRVRGGKLHALRLIEDSPKAEILVVPLRTDAAETYTDVVVSQLHEPAIKALGGRRLADYLAAELRGQLLRGVATIEIHDKIARGLAQKEFTVAPRRFTGEPIVVPDEIAVPGFAPLRVELYLARGAERPAIQVAAAGTLVADDIAELSALELAQPPWIGRELSGLLDFASFSVPPGTRRGVVPDAAAEAFVAAMQRLRPLVEAELQRLDAEKRQLEDRDVARDLRRALRGFRRRLPQFELPHVDEAGGSAKEGANDEPGAAEPDGEGAESAAATEDDEPATLFPPGPLHAVRVVPAEIPVAPGGERRVRATATDAAGRRARGMTFDWALEARGDALTLRGGGATPAVCAAASATAGMTSGLVVVARQDGITCEAWARVIVREADEMDAASALGIPTPHLVSDAQGTWRSRMTGDRWEVNDAHEDFIALRSSPRSRLRYLLSLLAREIVLRSTAPEAAAPLDLMLDILSHAERNLKTP